MRPRRKSKDIKKVPDVVDDPPPVDDVRIDEPEIHAPEHENTAHEHKNDAQAVGPKTIKRLGDLTTDEQNANKGTARGRD